MLIECGCVRVYFFSFFFFLNEESVAVYHKYNAIREVGVVRVFALYGIDIRCVTRY